MLTHLGAEVVESVAFRDHQSVQEADAERLLAQAEWHDATLVTTEKDQARMRGTAGVLARLAEASRVLPIKLKFEDADAVRLASLLDTALQTQRGCRRMERASPPPWLRQTFSTYPSSSGLSRGSSHQHAPEIADRWMVGTSPTMTTTSIRSMPEVL